MDTGYTIGNLPPPELNRFDYSGWAFGPLLNALPRYVYKGTGRQDKRIFPVYARGTFEV